MHNKQKHRHTTWYINIFLLVPIFIFTVFLLQFINSNLTNAVGVSYGYEPNDKVSVGMIVSLNKINTNTVEPANSLNSEYVVGVSVLKDESLAVVDEDGDSVYVASGGTVNTYVSDVGGDIKKGDFVSVSQIGGIGKKSDVSNTEKIVGIARENFSATSETAELQNHEFAGEVYVGIIEIELLLHDSLYESLKNNESFLEKIGRKIAGKPVSLSQIIAAIFIVTVGFVISGASLYGSLKGSFTSIGRNPLSSKIIYKGMFKASFISLSVMLMGILAGYLVLVL